MVLGADAAATLGIRRTGVNVYLGDRWFTVAGIARRFTLDPDLDRAAFIGYPVAKRLFDADRSAGTIYVRAGPDAVRAVRDRLGATANPQYPEEVEVSRPSDALAARAAAKTAFTSLFLGLRAAGRSWCRHRRWQAASARRSRSERSRGSTLLSGPPGWPRPMPCEPPDTAGVTLPGDLAKMEQIALHS